MRRLSPERKIILTAGGFAMFMATGLSACADKNNNQNNQSDRQTVSGIPAPLDVAPPTPDPATLSLQHPTPFEMAAPSESELVEVAYMLGREVVYKGVNIYFGTSPDAPQLPVRVMVQEASFHRFVDWLIENQYITSDQTVTIAVIFPGSVTGSHLLCDTDPSHDVISLNLGPQVYQHVYQAHFLDEDLNDPEVVDQFWAETNNLVLSVVGHEFKHLQLDHCATGQQQSLESIEEAAIEGEYEVAAAGLSPFIYILPRTDEGAPTLADSMSYIESIYQIQP